MHDVLRLIVPTRRNDERAVQRVSAHLPGIYRGDFFSLVTTNVPDPDPPDPHDLGLPDPNALVRGMDPDPDPDPSFSKQK